ncbi:MAG: hypothetical protein KC482_18075, partial [Dehalococcoidia bacterium]|nr:hypothetical protein [Dehalococcoidia bacterium]
TPLSCARLPPGWRWMKRAATSFFASTHVCTRRPGRALSPRSRSSGRAWSTSRAQRW